METFRRGAEVACLAARAQPANPRSRRRTWIFLLERYGQVSSVTDAGRVFLDQCARVIAKRGEAVTKARAVASAEPTALHVGHSPTYRRNSAENLAGISLGNAKRARQIA